MRSAHRSHRLIAGLLATLGLIAALGPYSAAAAPLITTKAYPVSVECSGAMQWCNEFFELTVFTSEVLRARFVASPQHCSDIRVGIQRDRTAELKGALDVPPLMSAFLAHGASTQEYELDPPAAYVGAQRILMVAQGREGGCNTGRLARYSGTLYVTTSTPAPAATRPVIREGASGESVRTIQYLLRQHGATLTVDGDFGPRTLAAVQSFQQQKGLVVDGIVGPRTFEALFVTVQQGSMGDAVRAVQSQLAAREMVVTVDGDFGPQTAAAVRAFQQQAGLVVDGIVGPLTWGALVGQGSGQGQAPAAGLYTLRNGSTVTLLGSTPLTTVSLQPADDGAVQKWMLEAGPDGHVFLRNLATGDYLASTANGDVSTQMKDGGAAQQWMLEPGTDERFMLRNRASGRVLARQLPSIDRVYAATLAAGAQGVPSVQWRLDAVQP
jgi:peptidoglycan hydrolase-like protein with peptidoglycan-binding domain